MSDERYEYAGLILSAITTGLCLLVAGCFAIRAAFRAKERSDELRDIPAPENRGFARRLFERLRPWFATELTVFVLLLLAVSLIFQGLAVWKTPVPRGSDVPKPAEVAQSSEWQTWRLQVHEKLVAEPVTKQALIESLRLRTPSLPDSATEAARLRRDQAIADVFLSYKGVRDIFAERFGIRENFLGTGLSNPLGIAPYSSSSIHEYLVENLRDDHDHVWYWKLGTLGRSFSKPLQTIIAGEEGERQKPENFQKKMQAFDDELQEIQLRVKNKEHPFPPMVRFARFNEKFYQHTIGHPKAYRVFTSNLSEVWDLTIQQAAEKSGYSYRTGSDGDTLFIWVYLPYHSNEFTPATWSQVLQRAADWLESRE